MTVGSQARSAQTIGGLGIALTVGICSRVAGWGALTLNLMIWFAFFPPFTNPIFDAEHSCSPSSSSC
jgi:hypothetical protein